ncbi:MAG: NUDIX domain-containing protein [Planctomycetota bacterium]|jgi:ADP-ribose pyrophosphatase YjhB (NUDIX family)|nr:NUDIX domain-containing protein [Planctomycetota bacterium]MDP6761242.1 NUDIX domain-containing protein [Planctomycetota bacterium]MDP6988382.1 NUDIX domain-containing protein [Planctomycetota bacterium]
MNELSHRIRVFVFRMREARPDYLLLRGAQGLESFWGPVQGPVGFGEQLEAAIRREVRDDVGIARPLDVIDLKMPARWVVGDEEIIEWAYGFRALDADELLSLDNRWADFRWAGFSEAYPALELENDRAAIARLHSLLGAA